MNFKGICFLSLLFSSGMGYGQEKKIFELVNLFKESKVYDSFEKEEKISVFKREKGSFSFYPTLSFSYKNDTQGEDFWQGQIQKEMPFGLKLSYAKGEHHEEYSLSQELLKGSFYGYHKERELAFLNEKKESLALLKEKEESFLEIVNLALEMIEKEERLLLKKENLLKAQKDYEETKGYIEKGYKAPSEIYVFEETLLLYGYDVETLEQDFNIQKKKFCSLFWEEECLFSFKLPEKKISVEEILKQKDPSISYKEVEKEMSFLSKDLSSEDLWPSLSLGYSYEKKQDIKKASLSFSWNLDTVLNSYDFKIKTLQYEKDLNEENKYQKEAIFQYENQKNRLLRAEKTLKLKENLLDIYEKELAAENEKFQSGRISTKDLQEAKDKVNMIHLELVQEKISFYKEVFHIYASKYELQNLFSQMLSGEKS